MSHARTESRTKASQVSNHEDATELASNAFDVFVGEWSAEGEQTAGPVGPAAKVTAMQKFEWLQGNVFMISRFDGHVGDSPAACVEVWGCDRETGSCRAHTFYNNGLKNVWDIELDHGKWQLMGDWNMGGRSMKVRCNIVFSPDGKTMHSLWEHSSDGSNWQTFWDLKARKVVPH
jgi:Protein of unknown function (DUF1579)